MSTDNFIDERIIEMKRELQLKEEWEKKSEPLYYVHWMDNKEMRWVRENGLTMNEVQQRVKYVSVFPKGYIERYTIKPISDEELNETIEGENKEYTMREFYETFWDKHKKWWDNWEEEYDGGENMKRQYPKEEDLTMLEGYNTKKEVVE